MLTYESESARATDFNCLIVTEGLLKVSDSLV